MEQDQKITPGKFSINYGLILGVVMILIAIYMYAVDMALKGQQWPVYIYYVVFPIIIIYAISKYKTYNAGILTLGEALKVGVTVSLISALVYFLYILVFNYIIDPEYNSKIIEFATEQIANSDAPTEAKEASLKMVKFFSDPLMGSAIWIAMSMLFGLVYSLLGGLVMKKTNA